MESNPLMHALRGALQDLEHPVTLEQKELDKSRYKINYGLGNFQTGNIPYTFLYYGTGSGKIREKML